MSNNVYAIYYELFPVEIFVGGRESLNMMCGASAVIEDALTFITITLLFNFSRFIPNSNNAYSAVYEVHHVKYS